MKRLLCTLPVFVLLFVITSSSAQNVSSGNVKAFVGARLYDGRSAEAIENAVLVVSDSRITAAGPPSRVRPPAGAQIVNLSGKIIIPGLISTHVHVSGVRGVHPADYSDENTLRQLVLYARYGVTTLWSLGGEQEAVWKARESQNISTLDRARVYLSGPVISARTAEQARQMVADVAARKPDIIKIRIDDNLGRVTKMAPEVYRAVIDEAHKRGLRVAAHIFYLEDAKDALRAGVDFIAHSVRDREIDDEFISLMKKRDIPYCPTLTREISTFIYESTPAFFSDPFFLREADREVVAQLTNPERQRAMSQDPGSRGYKAALPIAKRNLKKASDAGLLVVMGTDSGAFANRFQGYFEHLEMEMMADSGLTTAQILRAATSDAARAMRVEGVGAITSSAWADFIVLERDPIRDIRNTRSIHSVWIAGNQVKR